MILLDKESVRNIINCNRSKSYTYGLCRKDGRLFYVGVGIRHRVFHHSSSHGLSKDGNKLKVRIIEKENADIRYVIFMVHNDRLKCLEVEAALVAAFGRVDMGTGTLSNLTDGGEIGPNGARISDEARVRVKAARKRDAPVLSAKNKAFWNTLSEEAQEQKVERMRSRHKEPEVIAKIGNKSKERWADPVFKKKMSEKQKTIQTELADVHSNNMKAKWSDPEFRAAMIESRRIARLKRLSDTKETTD
jgi:hypothetical protein